MLMRRGRGGYTPHHPINRHFPCKTKPLKHYLLHPQDSQSQLFRFEMNRRDLVQVAPADLHSRQLLQDSLTLPHPQRKYRSGKKGRTNSIAIGNYFYGQVKL